MIRSLPWSLWVSSTSAVKPSNTATASLKSSPRSASALSRFAESKVMHRGCCTYENLSSVQPFVMAGTGISPPGKYGSKYLQLCTFAAPHSDFNLKDFSAAVSRVLSGWYSVCIHSVAHQLEMVSEASAGGLHLRAGSLCWMFSDCSFDSSFVMLKNSTVTISAERINMPAVSVLCRSNPLASLTTQHSSR